MLRLRSQDAHRLNRDPAAASVLAGTVDDGTACLRNRVPYAVRRDGTECGQARTDSTRWRPNAPMACLRSGSSIRSATARAKAASSLGVAYSAASSAVKRCSGRSNATIGLPSAIYSLILIIDERSL